MYFLHTTLVCIVHIGVGVIVYSRLKVLLEPEKSGISGDKVPRFFFIIGLFGTNYLLNFIKLWITK